MEYKITKEALQNDLLYDTLEALSNVMKDLHLDVYVVGALARDIAMEILKKYNGIRNIFKYSLTEANSPSKKPQCNSITIVIQMPFIKSMYSIRFFSPILLFLKSRAF